MLACGLIGVWSLPDLSQDAKPSSDATSPAPKKPNVGEISNLHAEWDIIGFNGVVVRLTDPLCLAIISAKDSNIDADLIKAIEKDEQIIVAHCLLVERQLPETQAKGKTFSDGFIIDYAGLTGELRYDFKATTPHFYLKMDDPASQKKRLVKFWKEHLEQKEKKKTDVK